MIDILFIVIFIIFPFLIHTIMKAAGMPLNKIGIPSIVIGSILIFSYIGLLPLYLGWDEYRFYGEGIQNPFLVIRMYFFTCISIVMILSGLIFTVSLLNVRVMPFINPVYRNITANEMLVLLILLMFCFIVLILYLKAVPKVAIWALFENGVVAAAAARSSMANDFSGAYHWYSLVMHDLLNVITFIFYASYLKFPTGKFRLLLAISLTGSIFTALMAIHKAPIIWLFVGMFFTYCLTKLKGNIPLKSIVKISVVIIGVLVWLYMIFMDTANTSIALKALLSRAFTGGIAPAYYYIEYFPEVHDFLYGRSFPNPAGIFPFEPFALTVEVNNWKFPFLIEKGIVGSAPTIFWAEAYANYNFYGVFIISFLVGLLLAFVSHFVNKLEDSPIKIGFTVWLISHYLHLSDSGISGYLFDIYLVGITFFVLMTLIISNNLKLKIIRFKRDN